MTNDLVHGLLEVGDEALWIWSHALIASTLGLKEFDADFEFIPVNLLAGEHKHPDFLRLNPAGKVPVLVDGDIAREAAKCRMRHT